jgi:hypothetical protein
MLVCALSAAAAAAAAVAVGRACAVSAATAAASWSLVTNIYCPKKVWLMVCISESEIHINMTNQLRVSKTRQSTSMNLVDYLGPGRALLTSELPTLRSILRQGILFREERMLQEDVCVKGKAASYTLIEQLDDMTEAVENQWKRANNDFQPPVVITSKRLREKLSEAWEMATTIARKKMPKASKVKNFESKLDRLFDLTKCHCEIKTCQENGCPSTCKRCGECGKCGSCKKCAECVECLQNAHICCSCPREEKLPVLDLAFLKAQREKEGEKGRMMITSTVDMKEQERQEKMLARKQLIQSRSKNRKDKEENELLLQADLTKQFEDSCLEEVQEQCVEEKSDEEDNLLLEELGVAKDSFLVSKEDLLKKRNMVEVKGLASTALRFIFKPNQTSFSHFKHRTVLCNSPKRFAYSTTVLHPSLTCITVQV